MAAGSKHLNFIFWFFALGPFLASAQFSGGVGGGGTSVLLSSNLCTAAGLNPFAGGIQDGHAHASLINVTCTPSGLNPFGGGDEDGHAHASLMNVTCTPSGLNPFGGGDEDGHAHGSLINVTCTPSGLNPFGGGDEDGHAHASLMNVTCTPSGLTPFGGGAGDGHISVGFAECVALPITLLYFNALARGRSVEVNWATTAELNNDFFTIERSKNGFDWQDITTIKGAGFSNTLRKYTFADVTPLPGLSYYRLKQTDFDGRFEYSEVKAVTLEILRDVAVIYPNPAKDMFHVVTSRDVDFLVSVIDAFGKTVLEGQNSRKISLENLSGGVYLVRITFNGGETAILKLIVTK